jgi:hypothetical protein
MEKIIKKLVSEGCVIVCQHGNDLIVRRADSNLYLVLTYREVGESYFSVMTEDIYQQFMVAHAQIPRELPAVPAGIFAYAAEWGHVFAINHKQCDLNLKFKFLNADVIYINKRKGENDVLVQYLITKFNESDARNSQCYLVGILNDYEKAQELYAEKVEEFRGTDWSVKMRPVLMNVNYDWFGELQINRL